MTTEGQLFHPAHMSLSAIWHFLKEMFVFCTIGIKSFSRSRDLVDAVQQGVSLQLCSRNQTGME